MKRKTLVVVITLLAILATTLPVLAHAPATGTVYEGVSVPGVALGDTRADVEDAYGHPASCKNSEYLDGRQGLDASCRFDVDGGGRVTVNFLAPDGGPAQASPDDVVNSISWDPAVSGWVTTAGINTTIARDDPQAVLDAYPNAEVTYWYDGTFVAGVRDWQLGISITRWWEFYCGCAVATISIFHPQDPPPPPPPPEPVTRVTNISLYANKIKGNRTVWASVWVDDEYWDNAVGATVFLDWTYPNGSTERLQAVTNDSGVARYEMHNVKSGTHSIEVVDVVYGEHRFDSEYGTLTSSIRVK
jgi:hypothetical protein